MAGHIVSVVKKNCSKCRRLLPLTEFSPDKRMNLGVGSQCRRCNRIRMRSCSAKNREQRSKYNREYRAKNLAKLNKANKEWREKNKDHMRRYRKRTYTLKKASIIAYQVEYRKTHREMILARSRRHYSRHKERYAKQTKKWRKKNPGKLLAHLKKRRALKCGAGEASLTAKEWREIKKAFGHRCAYCGKKPKKLTQDHYFPLAKGGGHVVGNVVPACLVCNCKKWANLWPVLPEFRSLIGG